MYVIPSDRDLELYWLYCRMLRRIADALSAMSNIYEVDVANSRVAPHAYLKSWRETDMALVPWDTPMAIKSVVYYPLGLPLGDEVAKDAPRIKITCDQTGGGILVTELIPDAGTNPVHFSARRTLVGINGEIQRWNHCCQLASNEDALMRHVVDLIERFSSQFTCV